MFGQKKRERIFIANNSKDDEQHFSIKVCSLSEEENIIR